MVSFLLSTKEIKGVSMLYEVLFCLAPDELTLIPIDFDRESVTNHLSINEKSVSGFLKVISCGHQIIFFPQRKH